MKKLKFQNPTGMSDILPENQKFYQRIYDVCRKIAEYYQFQKIETPILETSELFSKGVGVGTDIVSKEMYNLRTKAGDYLTLRPEGTAPMARAFIQHRMQSWPQPVNLWYFAPFFRYEKPQFNRYRQFWQIGFEIFGEKSPVADIQIILIFYNLLKELKIKNLSLEINSIGDGQCRSFYKKLLTNYFRPRESMLCSDCRRRLRENSLRVLDCKQEKCQEIISQAPQIINHLCEECHLHFKEILEILEELELPYVLNPYLVRGLDYYTKTVFEISSVCAIPEKENLSNNNEFQNENEENKNENEFTPAQAPGAPGKFFSRRENKKEDEQKIQMLKKQEILGGGRYDNLVKLLGGEATPSCGGAAGVERIINLLKRENIKFPGSSPPQIFLAQIGWMAKRKAIKLFEEFRKEKILIAESFGKDSLKIQLSRANKLGVKYVLILGQEESLQGNIIVKDMMSGKQEIVKLNRIIELMKKKIKK